MQSNESRIVDDIKRVKVCAPKPGNLYPDLTGIEESTTDSETEFTVGSTEPETATLEEPTETETEADYYVDDESEEDDSYDDEECCEDIYNTSLGRSILDVVNQQSALNKKRTIYPDVDSSTSDISVLEEMDEYLDECLALQGNNQEGPTPPKLNRGGKSPSATSTSFKYTQG